MEPRTSPLKCGSGSAYVKLVPGKPGKPDIYHHAVHFKKYRQVTKGAFRGWYEIWYIGKLVHFRGKWRARLKKARVPSSCIKWLPRSKRA